MNIKIIDWNNCHTAEQLESIDCNNCKNNLHRGDGSTYCATGDGRCHFELEDDYILRKSVIEEMEKRHAEGDYITKGFINSLPSVTLIRPRGHWIPVYQGDEIINYRCSECEFGSTFGKSTIGMNFCSCCGADNREVEEWNI